MTAFEDRVRTLAYQSDLRVREVSGYRARLTFVFDTDGRRTEQTCFITSFKDGAYWEFDCVSAIKEDMVFSELAMYVLKENSKHFRGFWCLEKLGSATALTYMHNIASALLTPDEFSKTCWDVTTRVDDLERNLLRR